MKTNPFIYLGCIIIGALITHIISSNYYDEKFKISKETIGRQYDSILYYKDAYHYVDSELVYITDSLKTYNALDYKATIDSLNSELFVCKYKLGRIQEYCNIVAKNSTQLKYLRGWINRVLDE